MAGEGICGDATQARVRLKDPANSLPSQRGVALLVLRDVEEGRLMNGSLEASPAAWH